VWVNGGGAGSALCALLSKRVTRRFVLQLLHLELVQLTVAHAHKVPKLVVLQVHVRVLVVHHVGVLRVQMPVRAQPQARPAALKHSYHSHAIV
jgi:hypothetical protein